MDSLQSLYADTIFHLSARTWLEQLDLFLVFVAFYLLLRWAQHRQAAFLLRGALFIGVVLFIVTIVLPLPTFDWLIRGSLIAILITIPIIFQPEIRRFLERIGRSAGMSWAVRQTAAESTLAELAKVVEYFSAHRIGALIVLEGTNSLGDIIETGVSVSGPISDDLLQAIFYGENPLHDGAVILHENQVIAAGCVLPLTNRPLLQPGRRLGTRHRAAVGMSETSDALVIVVSEETGEISVARGGALYRPLTLTMLRERLFDFYVPKNVDPSRLSLTLFLKQSWHDLRTQARMPTVRGMLSELGLIFVAFLLALTFWSFVIEQTNPARRVLVENIPLRVEDTTSGLSVMTDIPDTVSAIVETTDSNVPTIRPSNFQAIVSLEALGSGLHQPPIEVSSGITPLRILSIDPASVNLQLAPIVSRTMQVTPHLANEDEWKSQFQIVRTPISAPSEVQIIGPEPFVNQVSQVRASISLAKASLAFQEVQTLEALDEAGQLVNGITLQPNQAQINVTLQRRLNVLEVGVRAVTTTDPPPEGYWLSFLRVTPSSLTLEGDPGQLADLESYIDTLPVDISQATGELIVEVPLDLPRGIQALDNQGNATKTVTVEARITPRQGDLVLTKPVAVLNASLQASTLLDPNEIQLLLSGPLPTLGQIEANPDLVQVFIDATDLQSDAGLDITPTIVVPEGIQVRAIPATVLVTLTEP